MSVINFSYTRIFTSSTNFTGEALIFNFLHSFTNSALKNRNKIGDTGEPCGILVNIKRNVLVLLSNDSVNYLFFKKLLTQLTRRIKIFRIRKLYISLSYNT